MPRFFIDSSQICDNRISFVGDDAHHIARSLRMAVGDEITACCNNGTEYTCEIESFLDDTKVIAKIIVQKKSDTEPKYYIRLFQALPKGDKLDTVIQKAVECGASEIFLFQSERCVVKIKKDTEERKNERRQKIAESAAKQCGRGIIPKVNEPVDYRQMLELATQSDISLFCYEGEGTVPIGKVISSGLNNENIRSISVIIGSEGGFSDAEVTSAKEKGMTLVGLGKRILRTETASSFALTCISCITELM